MGRERERERGGENEGKNWVWSLVAHTHTHTHTHTHLSLLLLLLLFIQSHPQGSRSDDPSKLLDFKYGGFKSAKKAEAYIVPVTVTGTGALMPARRGHGWLSAWLNNTILNVAAPGERVKIVIHPAISTFGRSLDEVAAETRAAIKSAM